MFEPSKHHWQVRGLILNAISPLLPSCWGFSFALGCGVSFFGGIQHSPVDGCSVASCSFGVLTGEDECTSFYSAIFQVRQQTPLLFSLINYQHSDSGKMATHSTILGLEIPWMEEPGGLQSMGSQRVGLD